MTANDRTRIFDKVDLLIRQKFFDPKYNGRDWPSLVQNHREAILSANDESAFEDQVNRLLSELGTSHTKFFRSRTPVPSKNSINATFKSWDTPEGVRWVFQDVQPGGPADRAGVKPGDILLSVDESEYIPPQRPEFRMDSRSPVTLIHRNGAAQTIKLDLSTQKPKYSDCPYSEPQSVVAKQIEPEIGYVKVSMFPGIIGIDFAREVDKAMAQLQNCNRLIVDLRGNPGGGIGALRLMSYLTPDRLPVGYSLTRRRAESGYQREDLARFEQIPSYKWQLPLLATKFAGRDMSIVVVTEGKGPQKFHGRVVILINEHTAGSGEMVASFARENKLATLVGSKTAGRLLGGKGFKVGDGFTLMLPVGAYVSWNGERFEGNGVAPDKVLDWSPSNPGEQLEEATNLVRAV